MLCFFHTNFRVGDRWTGVPGTFLRVWGGLDYLLGLEQILFIGVEKILFVAHSVSMAMPTFFHRSEACSFVFFLRESKG